MEILYRADELTLSMFGSTIEPYRPNEKSILYFLPLRIFLSYNAGSSHGERRRCLY